MDASTSSAVSPCQSTKPTTATAQPPPIFICMAIIEEGMGCNNQQPQQQQHAASSSGAHSGSSPPPSMSSGASSASQDSAICASSLTTASSSSPLPPPDPGQASGSGSQNVANSVGIGTTNNAQSPLLLHLAWFALDPFSPPNVSNERIAEHVKQYKLEARNALDQLQKIADEIEQRHSGPRQNWLMCSRRSIRQSLYPFCAQTLLAKLTEEREEQVFSARLPLSPIFHRFLPFPLTNSSPPPECGDNQQKLFAESGNGGTAAGNAQGGIVVDELLERRLGQMAIALMESTLWQTATKINNGMGLEPTKWMEPVQQGYRPALCLDGHAVNPKTVVRARGLPWQVSDLDVALFFAGLDIAKGGIALCLGPEGRRNGECLVRFERPEHRDWALERHRRHLRQRYIEVYRAGADEFVRHAVGTDRFAVEFAQRAEQRWPTNNNLTLEEEGDGHQNAVMIVRMRGLPFTATEQQIRDFFASDGFPSGILDQGVMFVQRPDGRPSGDAFVLFGDEQSGRRAIQKHRQRMGNRYIELFRTTQAEVQQLFNARQQAIATINGGGNGIGPNGVIAAGGNGHQQQQQRGTTALLQQALPVLALGGGMVHHQQQQTATAGGNEQTNGNGGGNVTGGNAQQQPHRQRDCLRLRGLPYEAQVQQVVEFMGPQHARHVIFQGVHMIYNAAGHPSGEAFIQMESEQAAGQAAQECHNKFMELGKKRRYIEVFQCCAEDMSLLLNVLPTPGSAASVAAPQMMPPSGGPGLLGTPNGGPLPPLIPLAAAPFTPNGAPMPGGTPSAVPPLLAFPTTTGPFLPPTTLGTPTDPNGPAVAAAAILMPQFATPFAHLYSPETAAHFGAAPPTSIAEFWLRNGFAAAGAFRNGGGGFQTMAAAPNTFAPTPLFAPTPIAVNGNGGAAHFGGGPAETVVKLT